MGPRAVLFSDFDGTITLQDSNDMLTDTLGMGREERLKLGALMKDQSLSFSEGFYKMLVSVSHAGHTIDECIDLLLQNVRLDEGFKTTLEWCVDNDVDVVVVSSGMQIVIEALLQKLVGPQLSKSIVVYSNVHTHDDFADPVANDGNWRIKYRDSSSFGHDKNESIKHYINKVYGDAESRGPLFYAGDGVSDISASRSCDFLYAKHGLDLVDICIKDEIPFVEFTNFEDILSDMQKRL